MKLAGLLPAVLADPALTRARDLARAGGPPADGLDLTAPAALRPFAVALVAAATEAGGAARPVLAVTATSREADDLAEALAALLPPELVAVYPAWETLPHERLSPRSDTVGRRLGVLRRLAHPDAGDPQRGPVRVVVAPVRSVLQPQLKGLGDLEPVELRPGAEAELDAVVRRLADLAYARVALVTKRGEFAGRGGILDVFPPTEEHPSRVEFWGDEVEEIRTFAVADQRTIDTVDRLWAPPCRELLLTPQVRRRAAELATEHPALAEILDKLAEGIPVEGMESLAPALLAGSDSLELLLDCMPPGTHVLLCDPERIRTRAHDLVRTSAEFLEASWASAATAQAAADGSLGLGGQTPIDLDAAAFRGLGEVRTRSALLGLPWWSVSPFGLAEVEARRSDEPWRDPEPAVVVTADEG
ncbi:MAG TPA: transcription-repair coupling factor, partial [Pilimelia sp.]|nr:transcription-repair coupling factor [Pilimelia sp.]